VIQMVDMEPTAGTDAELILGTDHRIQSINPAAESLFGCPATGIVGELFSVLVATLPLPDMGLVPGGDLLSPRNTDRDHLVLARHHNGRIVPLRASMVLRAPAIRVGLHPWPTTPAPTPALAAADLVTGNRRLAVLDGLSRLPSAGPTLSQQLEAFLDVALALLGDAADRRGAIFLVDERGDLVLRAARNMPDTILGRCQCPPTGTCLCGLVGATTGGSASRPDCLPAVANAASAGNIDYFGVPLLSGGVLLGVLTCIVPPGNSAARADIGFLWVVADRLAKLIERHRIESENRRLFEENRRLNRRLIRLLEDERRRLARELHDDMGQSLTAIKTDAALIINRSHSPSSQISRSARAIGDTAGHLYDVIQSLLRQLRPSALDDLGLTAALEALIRAWREHRPGTACTLETEGDLDRLSEELNIAIYRIVQESLNNVVRHAAATRVHIIVHCRRKVDGKSEVTLHVRDNGRGVELESLPAKQRYGLVGMRERVEGLDGQLELVSEPGQGFRLTARLPAGDGSAH